MIKLIYTVVVADIETLSASLKQQMIDVAGISTIEDPDAPETIVFVVNSTTDEQKTIIDDEVRAAIHKSPTKRQDTELTDEEPIIEEPRTL